MLTLVPNLAPSRAKTRILFTASWVTFAAGFRSPQKRLCWEYWARIHQIIPPNKPHHGMIQ